MKFPTVIKARTIKSNLYIFEAILWILVMLLATAGIALADQSMGQFQYPETKKVDSFVTWHGKNVYDPYRWLENPDDPDTRAFIEAQNELFREFVDGPDREIFAERYRERYGFEKYGLPETAGGKIIYTYNEGLKNQAVFYIQNNLNSEPRVLLNPNKFSEDGTAAVSMADYSHDGSLMVYGVSESGSDWQTLHILSIDSEEQYNDSLNWTKLDRVAWLPDNSGFYYDRYPDSTEVGAGEATFYNEVYFHKLGTPQSNDRLIYNNPEQPELGYSLEIFPNCDKLFFTAWKGSDDRNGIYYSELDDDDDVEYFLEPGEAIYDILNCSGDTLYIMTSLDAPNYRVVAVDLNNPDKENWITLIPENDLVIDHVKMINDHFVLSYLKDARSMLSIFDRSGNLTVQPELPVPGDISSIKGSPDDESFYMSFHSFLYPLTIYRYGFDDNRLEVFRKPELDFNPDNFITKQIFYDSYDGTSVPLFITHHKDIPYNGDNPTILYAYGGFGSNMTPYFSASKSLWLEYGGILAVAPIRGGAEYGEEWHRQAILEKRQNAFDDFMAAAEWLIENEYTSREKLAIQGGSNGGLLVAACMVQRPDLFGAVLCHVPLSDMLRYHLMGVGYWWVSEFGNAEENEEHFEFLQAYSPYHNVEPGTAYPPTLIMTAESDDRVVPAHSYKLAAALQDADAGNNPILLRVETKAGHGAGKPTYKIIDAIADEYAFLFKVFGMNVE